MPLTRRHFLAACSSIGVVGTTFPDILSRQEGPITVETIACAEKIAGIELTEEQRTQLVEDLEEHVDHYASVRELDLSNDVQPALIFDPSR
ncbi:MAG: twin-arginine translocation signal domain-containing protein, partial [Bacteroidetes bacterium]|nr:twin-arginine translocation signal domain-containing protein [Bacteroidota bacterium]